MEQAESVHIYKCTRESVPSIWPIVSNWLEKSLVAAPPWWRIEDLYEKTISGDYILWLITKNDQPEGVALTHLEQYPAALVCNLPWIGGKNMRHWLPDLQKTIEKWSFEAGAKYVVGGGRHGWTKVWKGSKEFGALLIKEL